MLNNKLKILFVVVVFSILLPINFSQAKSPKAQVLDVYYCDLDEDGIADDVYAEVALRMWEGINYLVIQASVSYHGTVIYTIYRDNHVRPESEIIYSFYFYNVISHAGWYVFKVLFEIENSGNYKMVHATKAFDPPEGDGDVPPTGGINPGP